jgi:hypothetical protein
MPPSFKSPQPKSSAGNPSRPVDDKSLLGWVARNAAVAVTNESLRITPTGRQSFIANAKVRVDGPAEVRLCIRTQKDGTSRLQWRTEDQDSFPETGQRQSFDVAGGDWQELSVPLDVNGRLVHLRLFMPDSKQPTEIDWIKIGPKDGNANDSKRWDFNESRQQK